MKLNEDQQAMHALLRGGSCVGCEYLYQQDRGYSNYTVTDTEVHCALDLNPNLESGEVQAPWDWHQDPVNDNWPLTMRSRCHRYRESRYPMVRIDVEGEDPIRSDVEHVIREHSGVYPREVR